MQKNECTFTMGDGYNIFTPSEEPKLELLDKLKQQYEYEEMCSKRMERSGFRLG
jgi:hypothetical protein